MYRLRCLSMCWYTFRPRLVCKAARLSHRRCGESEVYVADCNHLPSFDPLFLLQRFYIVTSTQLKRLQSVSKAPIFSHFQESITGSGVIVATKQGERFLAENQRLINNNNKCFYLSMVSQRYGRFYSTETTSVDTDLGRGELEDYFGLVYL